MKATPAAIRESGRLDALAAYDLLDAPSEEIFDALAGAAAAACAAPMALLTVVGKSRLHVKAQYGLPGVTGEKRAGSFCAAAIEHGEIMEVPDVRLDARFADNPMVAGKPNVRFYAGAPLIAAGGSDGQPVEVVGPTSLVAGALFGVVQPGMRQAQQRAAILVDQIDLDQARPWWDGLNALPTEAIGEAVDRYDLAEGAAHVTAVDAFDEIESARMRLRGRLGAHPAEDLVGIGQEGKDGGAWRRDVRLPPDYKRFIHRKPP